MLTYNMPRAAALASALTVGLMGTSVTAQAQSNEPIKLTLHDWTGQLVTTRIMGEVLKKGATTSSTSRRTTSHSLQV